MRTLLCLLLVALLAAADEVRVTDAMMERYLSVEPGLAEKPDDAITPADVPDLTPAAFVCIRGFRRRLAEEGRASKRSATFHGMSRKQIEQWRAMDAVMTGGLPTTLRTMWGNGPVPDHGHDAVKAFVLAPLQLDEIRFEPPPGWWKKLAQAHEGEPATPDTLLATILAGRKWIRVRSQDWLGRAEPRKARLWRLRLSDRDRENLEVVERWSGPENDHTAWARELIARLNDPDQDVRVRTLVGVREEERKKVFACLDLFVEDVRRDDVLSSLLLSHTSDYLFVSSDAYPDMPRPAPRTAAAIRELLGKKDSNLRLAGLTLAMLWGRQVSVLRPDIEAIAAKSTDESERPIARRALARMPR